MSNVLDVLAFTNGNPKCDKYVKMKKIHIANEMKLTKIEKCVEQGYELQVYDNLAKYYELIALGFKVKFFSVFSIDVYGNPELFEEKLNFIDGYCADNEINCNFYTDDNPVAIKMRVKNGVSSKYVWILTKNEEEYYNLQNEVSEVKIYINNSPIDDMNRAMENVCL